MAGLAGALHSGGMLFAAAPLRTFLLLILFACLPSVAGAQDGVDAAMEAYARGDYATARPLLERQADLPPHAAFALGLMRSDGVGGPVDHLGAANSYRRAARQGHVQAKTNLGNLYDLGDGVPRDGATAQALYIDAARGGSTMAMNNLAYLWGRQGGLLPQALCLSARTLEIEHANPYYLDTYGFILLRLQRAAEAVRYFRRALALKPDYGDAREHLGDAASLTGGDGAPDWRQALDYPRDAHQALRLARKLQGGAIELDLDAHPPFDLRGEGFPADCAMPLV